MPYNYLARTFVVMAVFTWVSPVFASDRVEYVSIGDDGSTIPTIEVFQAVDQNGDLRYSTLKGSNFLNPGMTNVRVKVAGRCKRGYLLSGAELETENCVVGGRADTSADRDRDCRDPLLIDPHAVQQVPFTQGNRTLGTRNVDFYVPLANFQAVIDYGNEDVAARAGSLFEESRIRAQDWTAYLTAPTSFWLRCKRAVGYTGLDKWWGVDTYIKPVRVVYRGASADFDIVNRAPGQGKYFDPTLPNGQLADTVNVDANLLIVPNEKESDCKINLSGTFTTNGETVIFYYLVDDTGGMSPLYKVAVDQTYTAFVSHPIDLSEPELEGPVPGIDQGFSSLPTERLQGFYQIEVVSPHKTTSNIAEYNIEPCNTRPDTIQSVVAN
jgi:hypothetical protein